VNEFRQESALGDRVPATRSFGQVHRLPEPSLRHLLGPFPARPVHQLVEKGAEEEGSAIGFQLAG